MRQQEITTTMHILQLPGGRFLNLAPMVEAEFYDEADRASELVADPETGEPMYSGKRPAARLSLAYAVAGEYGMVRDDVRLVGDDATALREALQALATRAGKGLWS
jgi:hypothetical protein